MKKLKQHYGTIPPGGWSFTIPLEMSEVLVGTKMIAPTLWQLKDELNKLFIRNQESFNETLFEQFMCRNLPEDWCETCGDEGDPWMEERPFDAKKIAAFFITLLRWLRNGKKFVSKEEAQRRYSKCLSCPFSTRDVPPSLRLEGCKSCEVEKAARGTILEATKKYGAVDEGEEEQGLSPLYCKVCGCELRAKVWFDIQTKCW
jgi:hypothetical protein